MTFPVSSQTMIGTTQKLQESPTLVSSSRETGLPQWVERIFANSAETCETISLSGVAANVSTQQINGLLLLRVSVPQFDRLDALSIQRCVGQAYSWIRNRLAEQSLSPIRFWNFIPQLRTTYDDLDRYMVFNSGRFSAYYEWYGGADDYDGMIATATGVGIEGEELWLCALAASELGISVENPRQRSAYRYSPRFGPMPPCFSRGMICPNHPDLPGFLIGGTSSVRGEDSLYVSDVRGQTAETLENIAALISTADPRATENTALDQVETARVYLLRPADVPIVSKLLQARLPHLDPAAVDFVQADICRAELLVEIEGTARLTRDP